MLRRNQSTYYGVPTYFERYGIEIGPEAYVLRLVRVSLEAMKALHVQYQGDAQHPRDVLATPIYFCQTGEHRESFTVWPTPDKDYPLVEYVSCG